MYPAGENNDLQQELSGLRDRLQKTQRTLQEREDVHQEAQANSDKRVSSFVCMMSSLIQASEFAQAGSHTDVCVLMCFESERQIVGSLSPLCGLACLVSLMTRRGNI